MLVLCSYACFTLSTFAYWINWIKQSASLGHACLMMYLYVSTLCATLLTLTDTVLIQVQPGSLQVQEKLELDFSQYYCYVTPKINHGKERKHVEME